MTEQKTTNVSINMSGKNMIIAYVLWWFLGAIGVHRFYLGRVKSGVTMLLMAIVGAMTAAIMVGIPILMILGCWWLADAYFTQKMVGEENAKLGLSNSTLSVTQSSSSQAAAQ